MRIDSYRSVSYTHLPLEILDLKKMNRECMIGLKQIGIELRSPTEFVSTLSGGERQAIAIGRAAYFGARILILDEPLRNLSIRELSLIHI